MPSALPIWTLPPDGGRYQWTIAQIPLGYGLINQPFQVILEQFVPKGQGTDRFSIAIDDFFVRDHSCLPLGDCDFENGFCTWTVGPTGTADWFIGSGKLSETDQYAPSKDHRFAN